MIRDQIEPKMPPKSTLRPEEIAVFAAWIDAGAKDSTESPLDRLTAKIPSIAPDVALQPGGQLRSRSVPTAPSWRCPAIAKCGA